MSVVPVLQPFYAGWAEHERRLLAAIDDLSREQLALRPAPAEWSIWQLASHMAGSRAYWFHDVLGEGDPAIRDMFRVASTTVSELPLERWAVDDITVQIPQRGADRHTTRGWVVWHLMEHEAHHGGVISLVLGSNGLAGLEI